MKCDWEIRRINSWSSFSPVVFNAVKFVLKSETLIDLSNYSRKILPLNFGLDVFLIDNSSCVTSCINLQSWI